VVVGEDVAVGSDDEARARRSALPAIDLDGDDVFDGVRLDFDGDGVFDDAIADADGM
jgi:hypothetical protein